MVTPDSPRALLLTPIVPQPTGNGLAMRAALAVEALSLMGPLQVAIIPVSGSVKEADLIWVRERALNVICTPLPDATDASSSWLASAAGRTLLQNAPDLPQRARQAAPACGVAAARLLKETEFELIYVLRSYLAGAALPFLSPGDGKCRVLDMDEYDANVLREVGQLHEIHKETKEAENALEEALRYDLFTRASLSWFDTLLCSSELECRVLSEIEASDRAMLLPNAVDIPTDHVRPDRPATQSPRLLYLGNLNYLPNLDAAERLAMDILPRVQRILPGARLNIVGAGGGRLSAAAVTTSGVTVCGYRDDLDIVYAEADMLVVPLRAGGGTRIKLLEAAARHLPIVATAKAAEGLGLQAGVHLLVADDDEELAHCVCRLSENTELVRSITDSAANFVSKHHDVDKVAALLANIVSTAWTNSSASL
jgi:glycosyltransferase involved in cell wall biosynthesis